MDSSASGPSSGCVRDFGQFDGRLKPYPHEEFGPKEGRASDPVKYIQSVEQRARERQIAYETVRILREQVAECYRSEGPNHIENCKDVVKKYHTVISKKDLGQVQPNWADPKMNDGW